MEFIEGKIIYSWVIITDFSGWLVRESEHKRGYEKNRTYRKKSNSLDMTGSKRILRK